MVHFGCGAFEEEKDEFQQRADRVWFGMPAPEGRRQHDPYGEFKVEMTDIDHPTTRGMTPFTTVDAFYHGRRVVHMS